MAPGHYKARVWHRRAMAVAARAGSASPLCELGVQARRKGKDPPRLGSPRALCKNWRQRARLSCSRAAGSRPSRDGISQLRGLLALWDSTKATQTPQCGGSRAGVVCHRRAPRFDRLVAAAERCSRSNLAAAISQPRVCRRSSLCREVVTSSSPVHEHRAGVRIGVVAVRPRASFARGEQLAPHSPRLRSTFPLIHVSGQANSEHNTEALGGMWGCTTRRCRRWRSAAWCMGGEARGVPGSSCRSARGGRRLWVGLGSLAMRPAVSKIQNLTHSDPAMRRIRGLRVPCCCVERASPKSQRLLRYAVFRLLKLPLVPPATCRLLWFKKRTREG